jgi:transcription elongation factor Elf1
MCDKQAYRPAWTNDQRAYDTFKCPRCGYPQFCGCTSCISNIPEGILPYKWKYEQLPEGNTLELCACANCNFEASIDFWMDECAKQYKGLETIL